MLKTKFYDGVRKAQAAQKPVDEMPPFDMERTRSRGPIAWLITRFLENPRWALRLMRRYRPVLSIGNVAIVTRAADVREVLERQEVFQTPFGLEMAEMAGGANFILGMQDGACYRRMKSTILTAFPPAEVEKIVRPIAARRSAAIMEGARPGFDAVRDLLKPVPVHVCRDYFGMVIDDDDEFADWSIALSSLFFADFTGNAATRELAVVAADRMLDAIDRSIARALDGPADAQTPLARLAQAHRKDPQAVPLADIRSIMMGMISGFAPTNLLAAGNCLDLILDKPEAFDAVRTAVEAQDDAALDRAILEAMRFKPINIGPLRYVAEDAVIAAGTPRERSLRKGMTVMPATLSAMFDEEAVKNPELYDPERSSKDSMVFGHGIHWCIGSAIARIQIAECLRALFSKPGLRRAQGRAGRLKRRGAFPESLCVEFDVQAENKAVDHSFVTIVAPVERKADKAAIRGMIDGLGNPCTSAMQEALDRTGIVHFASLSLAGRSDPAAETDPADFHLVLEFTADGPPGEAILAFESEAGPMLAPIFEAACLVRPAALADFLLRHALGQAPFSRVAGLNFAGAPRHSVRRILAEERLAQRVGEIVASLPPERRSSAVLRTVRDRLRAEEGFGWSLEPSDPGIEGPAGSNAAALSAITGDWRLRAAIALPLLALAALIYAAFVPAAAGIGVILLGIAVSLVAAAALLAALVAIPAFILYRRFRAKEENDPVGGAIVMPDRFEAFASRENHHVHNHLAAISDMKPGLIRNITLRIGLQAVLHFARYVFPPGHLSDIGSIHFARWVLLPGTNKLMFFSNYGGSWESYLEDFITKAHKGLTGVWSNTAGYPRTKNLFFDGATDGARFKRWAREQQIPTLFWYSAYPKLNMGRIRSNAAIRRAIAGAGSDEEALACLARFGAAQRPVGTIEAPDVQSLFFGGMGRLDKARLSAIAIPPDLPRAARRAWLDFVTDRVSFGNRQPEHEAMIVAFGAKGLERLGLRRDGSRQPAADLPYAFRRGMTAGGQSRVLGDVGESAPEKWEWGHGDLEADALVVCYAATDVALAATLSALEAATVAAGMSIVARVPLRIEKPDGQNPFEHFGFRDNISQPVVDGTPRSRGYVDPQHRLAVGEFLLGYPDEKKQLPPSISVPASRDKDGCLAGVPYEAGLRDFGRNGSFLVVRQLEQKVEEFDSFCTSAAAVLNQQSGHDPVSPEWVGAKMMGRWKDGSSLLRNPDHRKGRDADNAFLFGVEDPQGQRCPLGAHIRRSNPRDSLGPDRDTQIALSKRHRILRVGRTYDLPATNDKPRRRGMVFMCLNADIERQFEFVQQTWIGNALFQGLRDESDPVVGAGGRYAIPTEGGIRHVTGLSSFVTVRGGGYFFMPSRRALDYLLNQLD